MDSAEHTAWAQGRACAGHISSIRAAVFSLGPAATGIWRVPKALGEGTVLGLVLLGGGTMSEEAGVGGG